jgi:hypothetical protein
MRLGKSIIFEKEGVFTFFTLFFDFRLEFLVLFRAINENPRQTFAQQHRECRYDKYDQRITEHFRIKGKSFFFSINFFYGFLLQTSSSFLVDNKRISDRFFCITCI